MLYPTKPREVNDHALTGSKLSKKEVKSTRTLILKM